NNFDRQTESRFIAALETKQRDSADRIKALMFVFEDLGKLDAGGVQTLLRAVDKADLALGLKGASDALRTLFFSNMSERGAKRNLALRRQDRRRVDLLMAQLQKFAFDTEFSPDGAILRDAAKKVTAE